MPPELKDLFSLLAAVVVVVGGIYAAAAWVVTPRLKRAIDTSLEPIVQRVAQVERAHESFKQESTARIDAVVEGQTRAESALGQLGAEIRDGIRDLASSIRELAEKHNLTAVEVAEIRGRLEAPPKRRRRGGRAE